MSVSSKKNILLVSHYTKTPGMVNKFYSYLEEIYDVGTILHPLYPRSDLKSKFNYKSKFLKYKIPPAIQYFSEMLFNFAALRKIKKDRFDLIICFDPLSFVNVYFYKFMNRDVVIVYYNLDYSTKRFGNNFLNTIYQKVNLIAFRRCDYFICPTERFTKEIDPKKIYKYKCLVFPHTVDVSKIKRNVKKIRNAFVFSGTLSNTVDFRNLLLALRALESKQINYVFDIYGEGSSMTAIEGMVKRLDLKNVNFKGVVDNSKLVNEILPRYEFAVAPYLTSVKKAKANHMFHGTDLTSKIVEYIAAGLPVVSTRLYDAFDVVEEVQFGLLVKSQKDWEVAIKKLLTPNNRIGFSKNSISFSRNYSARKVVLPVVKKFLNTAKKHSSHS